MRILIIRFSSIGDLVLTTPVIRTLARQAGAEVHLLTKKAFAGVLANHSDIYTVHIWEEMNLADPQCPLRLARYDWVIDLHNNLRSFWVKMALGRPSKSFNKLNWQKWVLVRLGKNLLPNRHIVHRYMDTVKHLGVQYDDGGLDYPLTDKSVQHAKEALAPLIGSRPFVAFVIGATHATKRLPLDKIAAICSLLRLPVALLGGKNEAADGEYIATKVANSNTVLNLCGTLSLDGSAAVVQLAQTVITHDTGLMHIAAALHKPIVSVWGNTVPAFGMYPFYPKGLSLNTSVEAAGLSCRPCSKIGHAQCPKGHFKCMEEISPIFVASLANV